MSYEGYVRYLCKNGHNRIRDVLAESVERCSCGARVVWERHVDLTNGYEEDSDPSLEVATPAIYEICNLGHTHVTQEATFKIPEGDLHISYPQDV